MWRILQEARADDFVIATGQTHSLETFVAEAFAAVGLAWKEHVEIDESLLRPSDIAVGRADPAKAARVLGWRARAGMTETVRRMVAAERELLAGRPLVT
jgi:GDPmannose 4,6-dehydratase